MEYLKLAEAYQGIEATRSRLEMADLLVKLFKDVPAGEMEKVVLLTQGKLAPDFKGIELGIAEKLALKAIYEATRVSEAEIQKLWLRDGDLGNVAFEAVSRKKQTSLFTESLSVEIVFSNLEQIASSSGPGSQDLKLKLLAKMMHDSSPVEAKYIARTLSGKLRLGIADMTLVDALAIAYATKDDRDRVELAYNTCSDLARVASLLAGKGLAGLDEIKLEVGIPLRAMLAERLPGIPDILEKLGGKCAFEYKYDGLRIQAHITKEKVQLFTRQLEDVTDQFPDLVKMLAAAFKGKKAVLEGECVPIDTNTGEMLPFQTVSRRRGRKYELTSAVNEFPVMLYLFDCLYMDAGKKKPGADLTQTSYANRRKKLESCIRETERVKLAEVLITDDPDEAEQYFQKVISKGGEGIMAKSLAPDSFYRAGSRGWNWIKFKRDYKSEMNDTVDLVVVGAFSGKGKRAGGYGALLMATYNPEEGKFETVTKLGTGFDDAMLAALPEILEPHLSNGMHRLVDSKMQADFWFEPAVVMEVKGAEITLSPIHTCAWDMVRNGSGLAIRFPRYTGKMRQDKPPEEATSTAEMLALYEMQAK